MKKMGIYAIKHIASGRVYIGSTGDISRRLREHRRELERGKHKNVYLQRTWNRHGAAAFVFEVVEELTAPQSLLTQEQWHIDLCCSADPVKGFNLTPTAGSTRGTKRSPQTRALLSQLKKGTKRPPEDCLKISLGQLGKRHSDSWRQNISKALQRPEVRAKLAKAQRAFEQTAKGQAHRKRLTKIATTRRSTPEQREAARVRMTGTKASVAAKAAMRAASRRFWDSPAGKARAAAHSQWLREKRATA